MADYLGSGLPAGVVPDPSSSCLVQDEFGTIYCPDSGEIIPPPGSGFFPAIGGAIHDAENAAANAAKGALGGIGAALRGVGTWVIVVLALILLIELRK
jgi:hypothetical protein